MRNTIALLAVIVFLNVTCKRKTIIVPDLPPIASKKLGCVINGQPWAPGGMAGLSPNLSINMDFFFRQGGFNINGYRKIGQSRTSLNFGIYDSLNYLSFPITLQLTKNSLFRLSYSDDTCEYLSWDNVTQPSGSITITKLDKSSKVVAGSFNVQLNKMGCNPINITDGYFEMSY